jgi:carboxymethylenebutenolidase
MGRTVILDIGRGRTAMGYLAEAANPSAPGVVVIQEWWGVQGQIKGSAMGEKRALVLGVEGLAEPLHAQIAFRTDAPPIGSTAEVYVSRTDIVELHR